MAQVDLFASKENTYSSLWFLIAKDHSPLDSDPLAHLWAHTLLYVFPPFALIQTVMERVRTRETLRPELSGTPCPPL